jgi:hypothetical protein
MRPAVERRIVLLIASCEINTSNVADVTGIPRSTVRDWLQPGRAVPQSTPEAPAVPEASYSYLLGFYLGDGYISTARRGV